MKRIILLMGLFLMVTAFSACSGDDADSSGGTIKQGEDAASSADAGVDVDNGNHTAPPEDAGPGGEADVDDEDPPEECVPTTTECLSDQCGEIDNGCGIMLDCGPCPCTVGVASVPDCGSCGLGTRSCASGETGQGTCSEPVISGLSTDLDEAACAIKLVFVDAAAGAGGDGSRGAPFSTYADALSGAISGQVIVLGGSTPFTEPLTVKNGVSVVGGFSAAPDFLFNASKKTTFDVPATASGDVFGLKAETVDQDTLLAHLNITTGNASAGRTNYGAYVLDSDKLVLRTVNVEAGKGGDGAAGAPGDNGADGANGEEAADMLIKTGVILNLTYRYFQTPLGGANPACPSADGGAGGAGRTYKAVIGYDPTQAGESTAGAEGGSAGYDSGGISNRSRGGGNGQPGAGPSTIAQSGAGGVGGGQVVNSHWVPAGEGVDGQQGPHGNGGGGGGGAYSDEHIFVAPPGGGGGAGGCGGDAGNGGQPGGGSFGLFLVHSDITIKDSSFKSDFGGNGGAGGSGGSGGSGGAGGAGMAKAWGNTPDDSTMRKISIAWSSGDGGDGSDGAAGGAGGGGAGGVSYGVYCSESQLTQEGQVDFSSESAALGGPSPGNNGGAGISKDSEGCD